MIQDIYPSRFNNNYKAESPKADDTVLVFDEEGKVFADIRDHGIAFTTAEQIRAQLPVYLFSIDDRSYFLAPSGDHDIPEGFEAYSLRQLRSSSCITGLFAAFTAFHLWKWYNDNRFCGCCGEKMTADTSERALKCEACGNVVYPRINPAVIVGVINGDSLLITRYRRGYGHNALIAGVVEIGETLEQTVAREVSEEAGIRVKNIRYYASQPWGMASDLLAGFFCELDGDENIRMDEGELKYAQWTKREDIELQPGGDISLTNEMMRMFKEGKV